MSPKNNVTIKPIVTNMSMGKPGVAHTRLLIFPVSTALERRSTILFLPSSFGNITSFRLGGVSPSPFMSSMG